MPSAARDTAGGRRPVRQRQLGEHPVVPRAGDAQRTRRPADTDVAHALDGVGGQSPQPVGYQVGRQALAEPAAVQGDAGRAPDHLRIDRHSRPSLPTIRRRRARLAVWGGALRYEHGLDGGVDQPTAERAGIRHGGGQAPDQGGGGDGGAGVGIEYAELRALVEARQRGMDTPQQGRGSRERQRRLRAGAAQRDPAPEDLHRPGVLAHDCEVVTGAGCVLCVGASSPWLDVSVDGDALVLAVAVVAAPLPSAATASHAAMNEVRMEPVRTGAVAQGASKVT
jgi:hypothetical protein